MTTATEQLQDSPSESPDGVAILTKAERVQLQYCEQRIEAGMASFKEVGRALASVRNGKLYRDVHSSFDAYLQERWHMGRTYAYNLMQAAEIAAEVSAIADIQTESHARELAKVEPEKRAEVIQEAAKDGPVTAKSIKRAASKTINPETEEPQRAVVNAPDDDEMRELKITNKLTASLSDVDGYLGSINPTRRDLIQAVNILRNHARKLEHAAGDLPEDIQ